MQLQAAKVALALAGVVVFMLGVRSDAAMLRWTGIGLVAVAFLLRFLKPKSS